MSTIQNILKTLESVSSKYNEGFGEKENNIYKILKENNIIHSFIKGQGFIIPSLKKPKKVVFISMAHPESFNYSFKANLNYNLFKFNGESFIKGGLLNTLNVAIILELIKSHKEILNDTIFVFSSSKLNSLSPAYSFLETINPKLRKELIYINIDLSEEKSISTDCLFRTKESSFELLKYISSKYNDYNVSILDENRTNTFLDSFNSNGLVGFNLSLPILNNIKMFNAMTSLFSIERFYSILELFLLDSYSNLDLTKDLESISVSKALSIKNKTELLKTKESKKDIEQFKDALYMTLADLNLKFENEDFLLYYLSSKYLVNAHLKMNFLITKIGQKKDLHTLFNTLIEYGVISKEDDNIYSFN